MSTATKRMMQTSTIPVTFCTDKRVGPAREGRGILLGRGGGEEATHAAMQQHIHMHVCIYIYLHICMYISINININTNINKKINNLYIYIYID